MKNLSDFELEDLRLGLTKVYDSDRDIRIDVRIRPTNPGLYLRAKSQIDRAFTPFDADLTSIFAEKTDLSREKDWASSIVKKLTYMDRDLYRFESDRIPQFSPRSIFEPRRLLPRLLRLGSMWYESPTQDEYLDYGHEYLHAITSRWNYSFNVVDVKDVWLNPDASSGEPFWYNQGDHLNELYKFGETITPQTEIPDSVAGYRVQSKEETETSIRSIAIKSIIAKLGGGKVATAMDPVKHSVYNFTYESDLYHFRQYKFNLLPEIIRMEKRSGYLICVSVDMSKYDGTVGKKIKDRANETRTSWFHQTNKNLDWIRFANESLNYNDIAISKDFTITRMGYGIDSGDEDTSFEGSRCHVIASKAVERWLQINVDENIRLVDFQYMSDDGKEVWHVPEYMSISDFFGHYVVGFRQFGLVVKDDVKSWFLDHPIFEYRQKFYSNRYRGPIGSIMRLWNSIFRLERISKGKKSSDYWTLRNIQIMDELSYHPLRFYVWDRILELDDHLRSKVKVMDALKLEKFQKQLEPNRPPFRDGSIRNSPFLRYIL
jgi:hypothetical protein